MNIRVAGDEAMTDRNWHDDHESADEDDDAYDEAEDERRQARWKRQARIGSTRLLKAIRAYQAKYGRPG